jgi:hypothetical protein
VYHDGANSRKSYHPAHLSCGCPGRIVRLNVGAAGAHWFFAFDDFDRVWSGDWTFGVFLRPELRVGCMATITGKEAEDFFEELQRQNRDAQVQALSEAKQAAALSGKEPFDLAPLERLCDPSIEPAQCRRKNAVRSSKLYYLGTPKCMTLAQLAQYIRDVNSW